MDAEVQAAALAPIPPHPIGRDMGVAAIVLGAMSLSGGAMRGCGPGTVNRRIGDE